MFFVGNKTLKNNIIVLSLFSQPGRKEEVEKKKKK